jgi:hypothetical protein
VFLKFSVIGVFNNRIRSNFQRFIKVDFMYHCFNDILNNMKTFSSSSLHKYCSLINNELIVFKNLQAFLESDLNSLNHEFMYLRKHYQGFFFKKFYDILEGPIKLLS